MSCDLSRTVPLLDCLGSPALSLDRYNPNKGYFRKNIFISKATTTKTKKTNQLSPFRYILEKPKLKLK